MNNAKHFIKRDKSEAEWRNTANQLLVQHDQLHRAASVVVEQLKDRGEVTAAEIYDLESAL